MRDHFDVLIIGAGAAGLAAGRRVIAGGRSALILEARDRIGGRGRTITAQGMPLDLGCEWLHSADRNIWRSHAELLGFHVEQAPAPWQRQTGNVDFPAEEQAAFGAAFEHFEERIQNEAEQGEARPANAFLEPHGRWNPLLDAVFSFISGACLNEIDARDYARYEDTGINWRVREGYGALISAYGAAAPVRLNAPALEIDHAGSVVRVVTPQGVVEARTLIVALPSTALLTIKLTPDVHIVREAGEALPLGVAEKVFFALSGAEEFPLDTHFFGRTDRRDIGSYHLRSLGRPIVEVYYGGELARALTPQGEREMIAFAHEELANLLGSAFPSRLTQLSTTGWLVDPFARGSYSFALTGRAEMRTALKDGVDGRIFFAGECFSRHRYSTAHGAFETGVEAAEKALAALA